MDGGRGYGDKGGGDGDKGDGGRGKRGPGEGHFGSGCYTKICCILLILLYFYVLQCNNWVSEVSNRRIEVNSGILTMNPALISLQRQGVFRQAWWFTLTSFTSDFGLSLVDYFPLIPKVHKIAVVLMTIHNFRNNYLSAVGNRFICSLDMGIWTFALLKKQTNKKKKKTRSNMNFLIGVPKTEYTHYPVGWLGEAKVPCILRHRSSNIFAYGWERPAILAEGKGRGGMLLFLLFLHFHSFSFLPCPSLSSPLGSYLSSPFLWETTQNDPQVLPTAPSQGKGTYHPTYNATLLMISCTAKQPYHPTKTKHCFYKCKTLLSSLEDLFKTYRSWQINSPNFFIIV